MTEQHLNGGGHATSPAAQETAYCCRERPEGGLDGPCTWPETDCYQNGPAAPAHATSPAGRVGLADRLTGYLVGRHGAGWWCDTCGRRFFHRGRPRLTYLTLLDHVVLDHHRLPQRWTRSRAQLPNSTWTLGTTATSYGTTYTLTLPVWSSNSWQVNR